MCRLSTCKNMVRNEGENESDSEEEHESEEESDIDELWKLYFYDFVLLIIGSCRFVLFTGCLWAKKEVWRHLKVKWLDIIYERHTIYISRVFDVKVNQTRYELLMFLLWVAFSVSRSQWSFE